MFKLLFTTLWSLICFPYCEVICRFDIYCFFYTGHFYYFLKWWYIIKTKKICTLRLQFTKCSQTRTDGFTKAILSGLRSTLAKLQITFRLTNAIRNSQICDTKELLRKPDKMDFVNQSVLVWEHFVNWSRSVLIK